MQGKGVPGSVPVLGTIQNVLIASKALRRKKWNQFRQKDSAAARHHVYNFTTFPFCFWKSIRRLPVQSIIDLNGLQKRRGYSYLENGEELRDKVLSQYPDWGRESVYVDLDKLIQVLARKTKKTSVARRV